MHFSADNSSLDSKTWTTFVKLYRGIPDAMQWLLTVFRRWDFCTAYERLAKLVGGGTESQIVEIHLQLNLVAAVEGLEPNASSKGLVQFGDKKWTLV